MAYEDPTQRQPKGDHNRRISLGLDPDQFAVEAGVSVEDLRNYERTSPDHDFDTTVAERVGVALNRLEAILPNAQTGRQARATGEEIARNSPDEDFLVPDPGETRPMTQRGPDGRVYATAELEERARAAQVGSDDEKPPTPRMPFRRLPD